MKKNNKQQQQKKTKQQQQQKKPHPHTEQGDLTENRLLANWVPVIKYWPPYGNNHGDGYENVT